MAQHEDLLRARDAATILGVSYATLKQWIYKKKIRSVTTAGGHHRIPQSEVDRYLVSVATSPVRLRGLQRISGRNQLVGKITDIKMDKLMAQIKLAIEGQRITSIITAEAAREMQLKVGDTVAALVKSTEVMIIRL